MAAQFGPSRRCDPFGQVESLLGSLPVSGWTAYGYLAFDLAKYYYPYRRTIDGPLLHFVVPRLKCGSPLRSDLFASTSRGPPRSRRGSPV